MEGRPGCGASQISGASSRALHLSARMRLFKRTGLSSYREVDAGILTSGAFRFRERFGGGGGGWSSESEMTMTAGECVSGMVAQAE